MLISLPVIIIVIIAFVAAIVLSGLIIKTAKVLARVLIFAAIFYLLLQLFGLI